MFYCYQRCYWLYVTGFLLGLRLYRDKLSPGGSADSGSPGSSADSGSPGSSADSWSPGSLEDSGSPAVERTLVFDRACSQSLKFQGGRLSTGAGGLAWSGFCIHLLSCERASLQLVLRFLPCRPIHSTSCLTRRGCPTGHAFVGASGQSCGAPLLAGTARMPLSGLSGVHSLKGTCPVHLDGGRRL